ncbi:MAG: hypothetical protein ACD_76C00057G0010 [uncultured bacterium]|nr:MAG: hypothetical protein ACD_76C00057G0010 [uncultured bacterium]
MCFSATVSFAASGALAVAGGASLKLAKKHERLIALVPLLFAIQQAIEGAQWLVPHSGVLGQIFGYAYLIFAFLLWPIYVPIIVYRHETEKHHKKFLRWFVVFGAIVTFGFFIALFVFPLEIFVKGNLIYNLLATPALALVGTILYSLAIVGPLLVSSERSFKLFGVLVFVAELAAWNIFLLGFVSVWCFFAAALSGCILLWFYLRR